MFGSEAMNKPKGEIVEEADRAEDEAGGTPPGGGQMDQTMGGADNTTADTVEAAKKDAEVKKQRG
jgi:hypothetical protein